MSLPAALLEQFRALLGPQAVLTEQADCAAYETSWRQGRGRAACVLRPADPEAVAAALAACVRARQPWVAQGAHTGLVLGATPDAAGHTVVISLERLRQPLAVDPDDRTVRVGAGLRLSALNAALTPYGLYCPIDLGADPSIGGMVATNAAGARFRRHGDLRRRVLGLDVVLADEAGTRLTLGRGLRKDNTGLDLARLWVGSGGLFGIVTAVTLEVEPLPTARAVALVQPTGPERVMPLLGRLERRCGAWLEAFEWLSGAVMRHALARLPGLRNPFGGPPPAAALLVELAGDADDAPERRLETTLAEALDAGEAAEVWCGAAEAAWALRHGLSEGLRRAGRVLGLDLAFRRSAVLPFRAAALERLERFPEFELCDFGHLADGGLHCNLLTAPETPEARCAAVRQTLVDLAVRDFGGSFSGEHGLGRANQADYHRHTDPVVQQLSGRVVAALSPHPAAAWQPGPVP